MPILQNIGNRHSDRIGCIWVCGLGRCSDREGEANDALWG